MILVAVAALAVLVGVVYVVLGKGGQLARFEADYPPLPLPDDRPVGAHDLGRVMLPLALWGYHVRAVDELLLRLTVTLRERDERIGDLEWRLSRLDPSYVPEGTGPDPDTRLPGDAYAPESSYAPEETSTSEDVPTPEDARVPGDGYAADDGPGSRGGAGAEDDSERDPRADGDAEHRTDTDDAAVGGNQR